MSSQYCSLCLYQSQILIPIRDEECNVSANILDTVHKYIGKLLTSKDVICVSCWASVDNFRKFCLLIAERQANHESPTAESTMVVEPAKVLEFTLENQEEEQLLPNENTEAPTNSNSNVEHKNVSLQSVQNIDSFSEHNVFREQNTIMVALPASVALDSILSNKQDVHSQLIKTEPTDTLEQKELTHTATDLIMAAERGTASPIDAGNDLNGLRPSKKGRQQRRVAKSSTAEDKLIAQHMQLICEVCQFKANCFRTLKAHYKKLHNTNGYVVCCQKRLYRRCILLDHINVHRDPAYFSCSHCAINFANHLCLRNHMLLKHPQEYRMPHVCAICGASFAKIRFLYQHARKHSATQSAVRQQCALCTKSFVTITRLQAHMKNAHDDSKLFVCKHCGCEVSGKRSYVRHLAQHASQRQSASAKQRDQRVQCTVCEKWLAQKYTLRKHMRRHAKATCLYACKLCDQKERTRDALIAHKRLCHGIEEQQHACNVCTRSFNTKRSLKEHMSTHAGNLFSCDYCEKSFTCSSNFHTHRKHKHPIEWAQYRKDKLSMSLQNKNMKKKS